MENLSKVKRKMRDRLKYLYGLLAHSTNSSNFGGLGESILREHLQRQGYKVYVQNAKKSGDLFVEREFGTYRSAKIEVKIARKAKDGRWYFCLQKNDKYGSTNYAHSDLLCLLQLGRASVIAYIMPTQILPNSQKKITLPSFGSEYNGKYAPFAQSVRRLDLFYQPYDECSHLDLEYDYVS